MTNNNNTFLLKMKNILYVEDDKSSSDEISFFLENHVGNLYVANNGEEGLKLFKNHHIDLIITDVQMPVMDGISMIKEIKTFEKNVPIIITTAFNETNYLIEALNLGINKYLLKPINLKELLSNIIQLIEEFEVIDYGYYIDLNGNVIELSNQLLEFIGYEKSEVIGNSAFNFVKEEDVPSLKIEFENLKNGNNLENIKFSLKKKDGTYVEVLLKATTVFNKDKSIKFFYCEINSLETYIKSQKKLEKEFKEEHSLRELITIESKIAHAIANEVEMNSFLNKTMKIIKKDQHYAFAFIKLKNYDNKIIVQMEHEKLDLKNDANIFYNLKYVLTNNRNNLSDILIVNDIKEIPDFEGKDKLILSKISSAISIPIYSVDSKNIIGNFSLFFNEVYLLSKDEINMYKNIVETIALGIESIEIRQEREYLIKELEYQVNTDQLTKATNRRRAFEILKHEIERANRYNSTFSLIYLDIDNFKSINDLYGHKEGDKVLIKLSEIFKSMIRGTDTFARWGGEEFVVILPEIGIKNATIIANKFRKKLEDSTNFTASFGVVECNSNDGVDSIIIRADEKMYKAKTSGKNKVISE